MINLFCESSDQKAILQQGIMLAFIPATPSFSHAVIPRRLSIPASTSNVHIGTHVHRRRLVIVAAAGDAKANKSQPQTPKKPTTPSKSSSPSSTSSTSTSTSPLKPKPPQAPPSSKPETTPAAPAAIASPASPASPSSPPTETNGSLDLELDQEDPSSTGIDSAAKKERTRFAVGAEDKTPWAYTSHPLNEEGRPLLRALVLGSGERENQLVLKIKELTHLGSGSLFTGIYCCTTEEDPRDVELDHLSMKGVVGVDDAETILQLADWLHIDAVFCGPDSEHLNYGGEVQRLCEERKIAFVSPDQNAKVLDGSMGIMKLMEEQRRLVTRRLREEVQSLQASGFKVHKGAMVSRLPTTKDFVRVEPETAPQN
mmetsp:Transcript_10401/g.17854  ORF Transcript_10401/g.17854 Transcript_10401/m.17854 type:complete len:370 (+) Transcript_10401:66-1175(+)